jgi:hypothetical protein
VPPFQEGEKKKEVRTSPERNTRPHLSVLPASRLLRREQGNVETQNANLGPDLRGPAYSSVFVQLPA